MAGQIHCPYHGACFDLRTGAAMSGPAVYGVRSFPVEMRAGEIFVLAEAV
jgi:nitrite reductase/ring-hydroxylating ferredoxin subunit